MDFQKVRSGYVVLIREGGRACAYTNDGVIVEQESKTFKRVYNEAKKHIAYKPKDSQARI